MTRTGRPRLFSEVDAVDAAKRVFWRRGYAGTSMRDLREELGVLPGSLYGAFGDKHALFLRALERFASETSESVSSVARQGAATATAALLRGVLEAAIAEPGRGCMLGNTAVERLPDDRAAGAIVEGALHTMEEELERVLRAGQQRGEVRADLDARSLALLVLALLQGLHVVARAEAEPQRLDAVVTAAVAMLARPAAPARRRS